MDAKTVANYMIYIMSDAFDDLTNMKINKLLYYAQGHYLSKFGKPLFDDRIEAWDHGPVVPAVYHAYKIYGDSPIKDYDPGLLSQITPEAEDILYGVARQYGKYTASMLRNKTHVVGSPWDQVYRPNQSNIEIPLTAIREYFAAQGDLHQEIKQFRDDDFIGYRDADGVLVLPKEWADEEI